MAIFYGLAVVLAGAGRAARPGWARSSTLGLVAYAAHLAWQVRTLEPDDGALALKLFKSNREAGFILLAAIALGCLAVSSDRSPRMTLTPFASLLLGRRRRRDPGRLQPRQRGQGAPRRARRRPAPS